MTNLERPTLSDYCRELLVPEAHAIFRSEKFFSSYLNGLAAEIKNGHFTTLVNHLNACRGKYVSPDHLFLNDPAEATLYFKPLPSILNKIYRINVLRPKKWPRNSGDTVIELNAAHAHIDDLFRTRFICRYLDGPQFSCERLKEKCDELAIDSKYRPVTTDLGYHAWHFYFKQPIADFCGQGETSVTVELQFTTQLAEVISSLTHVQYESSRLGEQFPSDWRWNVSSKQFRPFYIAHGLHLLEGIILEFRDSLRDDQTEGKKKAGENPEEAEQ